MNIEIDLLIKEADDILLKADKLIVAEVEKIARNFLTKKNPAHKFTMAMGTYFFQDKKGEIRYDIECKELEEFMNKYNKRFFITGNPMIFTATGIKITDW